MGEPLRAALRDRRPSTSRSALGDFAAARRAASTSKFSRYQAGSVVNAILASRGKRYRVDDETARLLDFGEVLWRLSEGRFDLTSGILRHAWQFEEGPTRAQTRAHPGADA